MTHLTLISFVACLQQPRPPGWLVGTTAMYNHHHGASSSVEAVAKALPFDFDLVCSQEICLAAAAAATVELCDVDDEEDTLRG